MHVFLGGQVGTVSFLEIPCLSDDSRMHHYSCCFSLLQRHAGRAQLITMAVSNPTSSRRAQTGPSVCDNSRDVRHLTTPLPPQRRTHTPLGSELFLLQYSSTFSFLSTPSKEQGQSSTVTMVLTDTYVAITVTPPPLTILAQV